MENQNKHMSDLVMLMSAESMQASSDANKENNYNTQKSRV